MTVEDTTHLPQAMPEEGELVLATVKEITAHGVYVSLDEYGKLPAFLHISEIATGWVRDIERYAKPGQKIVLKVIRVNKGRREIDLSLRQVASEERKAKIIEVKKSEKAATITDALKARLVADEPSLRVITDAVQNQYNTLYEGFEDVARRGPKALQKLGLDSRLSEILQSVSEEKISIPIVEVRGVMDIRVKTSDGIEVIKSALRVGEDVKTSGVQIKVTYLGTPRYRLIVKAENYKVAERALQAALERIKTVIEKSKGKFSFTREESRKQIE
ncbi:MAG: translation initiation factor IF-2 subunit alpha [Thaumarchaeota archaeon]|nr:translation initiation factor IF-2 subunit alpha [Nitrososphaerota archaeon]